ncbi:MAG: hypothetical protein NWF14_01705 [Candidatus Bathyarchaeota archaeon]|nr:hypothetical protein [Candidatus Bathyarchaeota archaeon]
MEETSSTPNRTPFFFIAVVSVLLVLSFFSLYQAVETYRNTGSPDLVPVFLSISAIVMSSYMILQMRRKPLKLGFEMPKVSTTIQCSSCSFKSVREFQKGDYIMKAVETCPECKGSAFIAYIYREVKEKEE